MNLFQGFTGDLSGLLRGSQEASKMLKACKAEGLRRCLGFDLGANERTGPVKRDKIAGIRDPRGATISRRDYTGTLKDCA